MKKIIAFSGSNSSNSINLDLVVAATKKLPFQVVEIIDLTDFDAPIFSEDLEKQSGIPASVKELHQLFRTADGFLFSSPEHNGLLPAFFKNILDWLSRIDQNIFCQKPVMIMSTSPGKNGGKNNLNILTELLPWWGAETVFSYSLGKFYENFDRERKVILNLHEDRHLYEVLKRFSIAVFKLNVLAA